MGLTERYGVWYGLPIIGHHQSPHSNKAKQHNHEASFNLLSAPSINPEPIVYNFFYSLSQRSVQILSGHGRHPGMGRFAPDGDISWCHNQSDATQASKGALHRRELASPGKQGLVVER